MKRYAIENTNTGELLSWSGEWTDCLASFAMYSEFEKDMFPVQDVPEGMENWRFVEV